MCVLGMGNTRRYYKQGHNVQFLLPARWVFMEKRKKKEKEKKEMYYMDRAVAAL